MMKNTAAHKKEKFVDSLKLPKDVLMGAMRVTLTGNGEAWIENYKGILEYTDSMIMLQGKTCRVCIEGKNLGIDYYTNEDMKVSGIIGCVRYL
jgi:sporulation protein YqfC